MCKKVEIGLGEMELMTVGMCLDYIDEYIEQQNPTKKEKVRRATQDDFDNF